MKLRSPTSKSCIRAQNIKLRAQSVKFQTWNTNPGVNKYDGLIGIHHSI